MSSGRLTARPDPGPDRPPVRAGVSRLPGPARGPHLLFTPPSPSPARAQRPLLVYFHGAGGRAEQGLPLLRDLAAEHGVLVLLPTSASSTWDLIASDVGADVRALDGALARVFADHPVGPVAFAGFSDGASYALSLALANGDLAAHVAAFSPGFAAPPGQVGQPRVWLSHGVHDAVLPIDRCGRRVARVLGEAGYDVEYHEFDGGHVVPPDLLAAGLTWWLGSV